MQIPVPQSLKHQHPNANLQSYSLVNYIIATLTLYTCHENVWHRWPVYEVNAYVPGTEMRKGGLPLPPALQYLILII